MKIEPRSLVQIRHIPTRRVIHWQGEDFAIKYNGKIAICVSKASVKDFVDVWDVILGTQILSIGSGWLICLNTLTKKNDILI